MQWLPSVHSVESNLDISSSPPSRSSSSSPPPPPPTSSSCSSSSSLSSLARSSPSRDHSPSKLEDSLAEEREREREDDDSMRGSRYGSDHRPRLSSPRRHHDSSVTTRTSRLGSRDDRGCENEEQEEGHERERQTIPDDSFHRVGRPGPVDGDEEEDQGWDEEKEMGEKEDRLMRGFGRGVMEKLEDRTSQVDTGSGAGGTTNRIGMGSMGSRSNRYRSLSVLVPSSAPSPLLLNLPAMFLKTSEVSGTRHRGLSDHEEDPSDEDHDAIELQENNHVKPLVSRRSSSCSSSRSVSSSSSQSSSPSPSPVLIQSEWKSEFSHSSRSPKDTDGSAPLHSRKLESVSTSQRRESEDSEDSEWMRMKSPFVSESQHYNTTSQSPLRLPTLEAKDSAASGHQKNTKGRKKRSEHGEASTSNVHVDTFSSARKEKNTKESQLWEEEELDNLKPIVEDMSTTRRRASTVASSSLSRYPGSMSGSRIPNGAPFEDVVTRASFEFGAVLGEGAFGQVRLCRHRASGLLYAVKVLKKDAMLRSKQAVYAQRERELLSTLDHPNVPHLAYTFTDPKRLFLVMEYISGGELKRQISKIEDPHRRDIARKFYIAELVCALEYVHSRGIVHRDVKPDNLLLGADGHLRLVDFGIAKQIEGPAHHTFCGTAEYLAPEMLIDSIYGFAVDWWALGCIIYELYVGRSPFQGSSLADTRRRIVEHMIEWPSQFPADAKSLTERLLVPDPSKRYGSGMDETSRIKSHSYFSDIDFLTLGISIPPILPRSGDSGSSFSPSLSKKSLLHAPNLRDLGFDQQQPLFSSGFDSDGSRSGLRQDSKNLREAHPQLRKLPPRPTLTPFLSISDDISFSPSRHTRSDPNSSKLEDRNAEILRYIPSPNSSPFYRSTNKNQPSFIEVLREAFGRWPATIFRWCLSSQLLVLIGGFRVAYFSLSEKPGSSSRKVSSRLIFEEEISSSGSGYCEPIPDSDGDVLYDMQRRLVSISLKSKKVLSLDGQHIQPISCASMCSADTLAASGSIDGQVIIWDTSSRRILHSFHLHAGYSTSISWQPNGLLLAVGCKDGQIFLYDASTSDLIKDLQLHEDSILSISWHPSGAYFACSGEDHLVHVVDAMSWTVLSSFLWMTPPERLVWSWFGDFIAVSSEDGIRIFQFPDIQLAAFVEVRDEINGSCRICWQPNGTILACAGGNMHPVLFDIASCSFRKCSGLDSSSGGMVIDASWSQDGRFLGICRDDGSWSLYQPLEDSSH